MLQGKKSACLAFLHLGALVAFSVSPLYNLLGNQAEFFVANQVQPITIVWFSLIVSFLLPVALFLLTCAAGLLGKSCQSLLHAVFLALFAALAFSGLISQIEGLSTPAYLVLLLVLTAVFMAGYFRFPPIKMLLTVLSVTMIFFPLQFLFFSNVTPLILPGEAARLKLPVPDPSRTYPPVVMVIFDELALASLLDSQGDLDAGRYPNFARLARKANWFKGAHTVADNTVDAVPAIITGRYPEGFMRNATEQSDNIFTVLGATHRIDAVEKVTQLCPQAFCKRKNNLFKHLSKLFQDSSVVYLHLLLPKETRKQLQLPDITQNWGGFKLDEGAADDGTKATSNQPAVKAKKIGEHNHRVRVFRDFLKKIKPINASAAANPKPPFYFIHILLPHVPLIFLPSGKYYGTGRNLGPEFPYPWNHDNRLLSQHYQRHLLQVSTVDMLLGELLDKLEQNDLYDQSMLIVMADHGVSSHPGEPRRTVTQGNYADLLPIPLFIKLPKQSKPVVIETPVKSTDVYSTLVDVMRLKPPVKAHGSSLFSKSYPAFNKLLVLTDKHSDKKATYPVVSQSELKRLAAVKTATFGSGDLSKLFQFGPHKDWIAKPLANLKLPVRPADPALTYTVQNPDDYRSVDLKSGYIPAMLSGTIKAKQAALLTAEIWVALNGVLWSTYPVLEKSDEKTLTFYAMLPEAAFVQGKNTIQIIIPAGNLKNPKALQSVRLSP